MKNLKNRTSTISYDASGVLHITHLKKSDVDLEDVIDTFLLAKSLTNGEPTLVLVDTRQKRSITTGAKKLISKENVPAKHIAKAVIVNSTLSKNFYNFLTRFKNSRFPVRKFTSEADAKKWLKMSY